MSSGGHRWPACGNSDVGSAVAEHGPENVEAPGQREHGLGVDLAFGALSVVGGPGGAAALQSLATGPVEDPQELPVVAAGGACR